MSHFSHDHLSISLSPPRSNVYGGIQSIVGEFSNEMYSVPAFGNSFGKKPT